MRDQPPDCLTSVQKQVEAVLDPFLSRESERWAAVDPRLGEAVDLLATMVRAGGKRLRAAFCYWSWFGVMSSRSGADPTPAETERILDICAAFELLQAFALIHDDIMDDSATRRGEPTVHTTQANRLTSDGWQGEPRRYGEGVAILVGDLAHVYADQFIGMASEQTRSMWDNLRIELNLGQYLDLRSAAAGDLDATTAAMVSSFKSARYTIVRPLQLGASVASPLPPQLENQLERFGMPLGRAFQLRDDLLGVLGEQTRTGKPVGEDLREGKPTELVALALERANHKQREVLQTIGSPTLDDVAIEQILDVLQETGAVDAIEQRIGELVLTADSEAVGLGFSPDVQETLGVLARYVASRTR